VATVVAKLFNIVAPTRAYFGRKDYQQTVVIRRMVKDLDFGLEVVVCPTIREHDGLAMSSRNIYLAPDERGAAGVLYRSLRKGEEAILAGELSGSVVRRVMEEVLGGEKLVRRVDYAAVVDPETLEDVEIIGKEVVLAGAVFIGATRLIDNIVVNR
jgi:pantoate--beta-alanine ligase